MSTQKMKMSSSTKNYIVSQLRRVSMKWKPKNIAKKLHYRGPATYECDECHKWIYDGKKSLEKHLPILTVPKNITVIKARYEMDHKLSCVPKAGFIDGVYVEGPKKSYWWNWSIYLTRMFCQVDDYAGLCEHCHGRKTNEERHVKN